MSSVFRPYLQPIYFAGSFSGGSPFTRSGETEGKVLKKIQVSRLPTRVCAIAIWLTGDSNPLVYGNPSGAENQTFEFREGERITRLQLQSSITSIGGVVGVPVFTFSNLGRIRFSTSMLGEFEYGMSNQPNGQLVGVNVGSGVCVGLEGVVVQPNTINMLGFMFLRQIDSVRLSALEYPTSISPTITNTILEQLPSTINKNDDDQPLHWVLAGSRQFVTSSTWTTSQPAVGLVSHLSSNISLNVDLGINAPKLVPTGPAGASTTFRWEIVRTFPSANVIQGSIRALTVKTDEYSVWCHVSDTVAPAQSLPKRTALVGLGNIRNLPCSARIQVFTGGHLLPGFSFPVQILYSGQAHSDVQILN